MFIEIDFQIHQQAERSLFGDRGRSEKGFRKLLAALNTQHSIGLPSWFFSYLDSGVADPQADTCIAMAYTQRGLRIVGIGSRACALVSEKAGAIHAALMMAANHIIPLHRREGEHTASLSLFQRHFFVKSMMVGNTNRDNFWIQAADRVKFGSDWMTEGKARLEQTIVNNLVHQIVFLDGECDDLEGDVGSLLAPAITGKAPYSEVVAELAKRLDVKVHSIEKHTFGRVAGPGALVVLKGIEFTMRGEFTGPWFLGRQKIEGRGVLVPARGVWTQPRAREQQLEAA